MRRHQPDPLTLDTLSWSELPSGLALQAAWQAYLDEQLAEAFGYYQVAVGHLSRDLDFSASPVRHHFQIGETIAGSDCCAVPTHLPIASDTVDAVILSFGLDYCVRPRLLLRECARVLMPGGKLLMIGMNPISLFGLKRFFSTSLRSSNSTVPPAYAGHFIHPGVLEDWFSWLDLSVEKRSWSHYRWPESIDSPATVDSAAPTSEHWLDKVAKRCWPHFAGTYMITAVKHRHGMTPLTPRWKNQLVRTRGLMTPTSRNCHE